MRTKSLKKRGAKPRWAKKLNRLERQHALVLLVLSKNEMEEAFDHKLTKRQWKRIKAAFWESAIMSDVLGELTEATASVLNVDDSGGGE